MEEIEIALLVLKRAGFGDKAYKREVFEVVDEVKIYSIYRDLNAIDSSYALEFTKLVEGSKTLGVFEFIGNFLSFAVNHFSSKNLILASDLTQSEFMAKVLDFCGREESDLNKIRLSGAVKDLFLYEVSPINRTIKQYTPVKDN